MRDIKLDVIVEGKITKDEGVKEILMTVVDLKQVFNPVLRITSDDNSVEGRIGFCKGGFILGGESNNSDNGWKAIKSLLEIKEGNYAILEPKSDNVPEVNQSLWIKVERVLPMLSNLPDSPDVLLVTDTSKPVAPAASPAKISKSSLDAIRPDFNAKAAKPEPVPASSSSPNAPSPSLRPNVPINPAENNYQVNDNYNYGLGVSFSPTALVWIIGGILAIAIVYMFIGILAHSLSGGSAIPTK